MLAILETATIVIYTLVDAPRQGCPVVPPVMDVMKMMPKKNLNLIY
jgi:hypothetical protein